MTLVSIIGDFHSSILPIFYHFKEKLLNHVVVYDDFRHDVLQANKLLIGTKRFIEEKSLPITTYSKQIDEDNHSAIESLAAYISTFIDKDKATIINITDGLASIAYGLIHALEDKDVQFLSYDRFDNTYTLMSKESMGSPIKVKSMSIKDHLAMKNIIIERVQDITLAQKYQNEISRLFDEYEGDKPKYLKENELPEYIKTTQKGFLFELYIYNLIKDLNFDDIALGVKVHDYYIHDDYFSNEFDILIMKENHLHMIECKFRDDFDQRKTANFIYKLDSLRNTLDNDALMLFLTDDTLYNPQTDAEFEDMHAPYKRANARRIFLRGSPIGRTERFIKDVDSIFGLHTPANKAKTKPKRVETPTPKPLKVNKREALNAFVQAQLELEVDIFDTKEMRRLLNYKVHYRANERVNAKMQNDSFKNLIRFMSTIKDDSEIAFIYDYFQKQRDKM